MSRYRYKQIQDKSTDSFRVDKTWKLNQSSTEMSVYSYESGSAMKSATYQKTPTTVSESYWHSLSFNFYASASHYEGVAQYPKNHKIHGRKFTKDTTINAATLKWVNDYYSLGHISYNLTNPIHLNKFGKNWIQGNVISISQGICGEGIKPGSVVLTDKSTAKTIKLKDDERGNLYAVDPFLSQSNNSPSSSTNHIGNVFYNHGLIVLKETSSYSASCLYTDVATSNFNLEFKSMTTINSKEYVVTLEPNEFMTTTNPTAGDGSGSLAPNITAKNGWTPYLTTIGLYDSQNRLLMIARLSQPIKRSKKLPLTIKLRYDY